MQIQGAVGDTDTGWLQPGAGILTLADYRVTGGEIAVAAAPHNGARGPH